jgi:hypothetical protein
MVCTVPCMYQKKHNRSEMVAVLGPYEALPYYIHVSKSDFINNKEFWEAVINYFLFTTY